MTKKYSLIKASVDQITKEEKLKNPLPFLEEVHTVEESGFAQKLQEGKWINVRFKGAIRIDQPTYGAGQIHAHILGRKGKEIGVVNIDGTASHGSKCKLPVDIADELRARGFAVKQSNIVEWVILSDQPQFLAG